MSPAMSSPPSLTVAQQECIARKAAERVMQSHPGLAFGREQFGVRRFGEVGERRTKNEEVEEVFELLQSKKAFYYYFSLFHLSSLLIVKRFIVAESFI